MPLPTRVSLGVLIVTTAQVFCVIESR